MAGVGTPTGPLWGRTHDLGLTPDPEGILLGGAPHFVRGESHARPAVIEAHPIRQDFLKNILVFARSILFRVIPDSITATVDLVWSSPL